MDKKGGFFFYCRSVGNVKDQQALLYLQTARDEKAVLASYELVGHSDGTAATFCITDPCRAGVWELQASWVVSCRF